MKCCDNGPSFVKLDSAVSLPLKFHFTSYAQQCLDVGTAQNVDTLALLREVSRIPSFPWTWPRQCRRW